MCWRTGITSANGQDFPGSEPRSRANRQDLQDFAGLTGLDQKQNGAVFGFVFNPVNPV
jgi:hypothetical protein